MSDLIEIVFYIILLVLCITTLYGALSAAPWLPSRKREVGRMLKLADIKNGQKVYDLGCGDGRILFEAEKLCPGAQFIGYEIALPALFFAWLTKFLSHSKVTIKMADLFKQDISAADVVFIYLMQKAYHKTILKLKRELKPGTKVIVNTWPIKEWEYVAKNKEQKTDVAVYLYII